MEGLGLWFGGDEVSKAYFHFILLIFPSLLLQKVFCDSIILSQKEMNRAQALV